MQTMVFLWPIDTSRLETGQNSNGGPGNGPQYMGQVTEVRLSHDDVIKWELFPRYWPFVRGIYRSPVNSLTKASDAELWCCLWPAPEQMVVQTLETPVIWDAIVPIMTSLWCFYLVLLSVDSWKFARHYNTVIIIASRITGISIVC